jgi:hypothetical protein
LDRPDRFSPGKKILWDLVHGLLSVDPSQRQTRGIANLKAQGPILLQSNSAVRTCMSLILTSVCSRYTNTYSFPSRGCFDARAAWCDARTPAVPRHRRASSRPKERVSRGGQNGCLQAPPTGCGRKSPWMLVGRKSPWLRGCKNSESHADLTPFSDALLRPSVHRRPLSTERRRDVTSPCQA